MRSQQASPFSACSASLSNSCVATSSTHRAKGQGGKAAIGLEATRHGAGGRKARGCQQAGPKEDRMSLEMRHLPVVELLDVSHDVEEAAFFKDVGKLRQGITVDDAPTVVLGLQQQQHGAHVSASSPGLDPAHGSHAGCLTARGGPQETRAHESMLGPRPASSSSSGQRATRTRSLRLNQLIRGKHCR